MYSCLILPAVAGCSNIISPSITLSPSITQPLFCSGKGGDKVPVDAFSIDCRPYLELGQRLNSSIDARMEVAHEFVWGVGHVFIWDHLSHCIVSNELSWLRKWWSLLSSKTSTSCLCGGVDLAFSWCCFELSRQKNDISCFDGYNPI